MKIEMSLKNISLKMVVTSIIGLSVFVSSVVALNAYADDFIYFQSEADVHISQNNNRVCIEDSAKLVILEAQYPSGSSIPPHVAVMMANLKESVAVHCAQRG